MKRAKGLSQGFADSKSQLAGLDDEQKVDLISELISLQTGDFYFNIYKGRITEEG